jgi:hypothetical protein
MQKKMRPPAAKGCEKGLEDGLYFCEVGSGGGAAAAAAVKVNDPRALSFSPRSVESGQLEVVVSDTGNNRLRRIGLSKEPCMFAERVLYIRGLFGP